jgi:hypothetical protein
VQKIISSNMAGKFLFDKKRLFANRLQLLIENRLRTLLQVDLLLRFGMISKPLERNMKDKCLRVESETQKKC